MKFGIDLGGSHIAIGLVNKDCDIVEKRTYYMSDNTTMPITEYIVNSIVHGIKEILSNTKQNIENIEMIGVAVPGTTKDGYVKNVINLDIDKFNISDSLRNAFGDNLSDIPIILKNDAKCAALAEKEYGNLKNYKDCVFLCIGTGIGGAAFFNDKLIEPKRYPGFEFGHMVIKKDGEKCNCGNKGCFEVYGSKRKFKNDIQKLLEINEYIEAAELIPKIKENMSNEKVRNLLETYIDDLAIGISNIINIFEPEAISIGGSMSHYESLIFDRLKEKIYTGEYLFNKENPPEILAAQTGNEAGIIGATLLSNN